MSRGADNCDLAFFSYFFPPENGAGAVRLGEFAKGLNDAGRNIKVLTPLPNYPAGEIYPGYNPWKYVRETWKGIDVLRVPILPPKGKGGARRMLSYMSFNISADYARSSLLNVRPKAVFASVPPLPTILPAMGMARKYGVPFILDIRDLWPEIAVALELMKEGSQIHKYLSGIAHRAYTQAGAITVTTQGDADAVAKWGIDRSKIHIIPNGANCEIFRPDEKLRDETRRKLGFGDEMVIVYSGSFGRGMNDLDILLETASLVRDDPGIKFLLIGEGDKRPAMEETVSRNGLSNVVFVPSLPLDQLNAHLNAADIGFIPRRELGSDTGGNVPVKMFEYLAVGLPLLLTCIRQCEAYGIFEKASSAGCWFPSGDAENAARWIRDAKPNLQTLKADAICGRDFVMANYSRSSGVSKLNEILSTLID